MFEEDRRRAAIPKPKGCVVEVALPTMAELHHPSKSLLAYCIFSALSTIALMDELVDDAPRMILTF